MIVINFKNYKTGKSALNLAKQIEKYLPKAIVAVPTIDVYLIKANTKLKVFAQHINSPASPTKSTGFVTAEIIKAHGVIGSLLNHSEHQMSLGGIQAALGDLEEEGLKSIVCVPTLKVAEEVIKLKPYAIAFEDLELIATGKSITKYNPKALKNFIKIMKKTNIIPLCGAGISSYEDVKEANNLGCKGVLIASAIANSKNPSSLLRKLKEFQ